MAGDGLYSSPMRPISKWRSTTRKTARAATYRRRQRTGFMCRVIPCSVTLTAMINAKYSKTSKEICMHRVVLVILTAVGLTVGGSLLLTSRPAAAQSQRQTAVFNSDGTMKLPAGFRRWIFVGAPLTPNGLNNGNAGFPEYHHVYVEQKNLDVYLKTGSFPEGTVIVKELTRVLNPTFPDGSRTEPSGRGFFNGGFNGID